MNCSARCSQRCRGAYELGPRAEISNSVMTSMTRVTCLTYVTYVMFAVSTTCVTSVAS
jgi:hypothetical protein